MSDLMAQPDSMVTLQEAMARTGFSYSHIRGLIASGTLIGYRVPGGRAVRVKRRDLDCLFEKIEPRRN